MGETDTAVDEENRKTGQGEEPVEDVSTTWCQVDECKTSEEQLNDNDVDGTSLLVDVRHELRSHAYDKVSLCRSNTAHLSPTVRSQSLNCSGGAESTRVCNTHDGDKDDSVEDRWEDLDASKLDRNDEGGVAR